MNNEENDAFGKLSVLAEENPLLIAVAGLAIAASTWFMVSGSSAAVPKIVNAEVGETSAKAAKKKAKKKAKKAAATTATAQDTLAAPTASAPSDDADIAAKDGVQAEASKSKSKKKKKKKSASSGADQNPEKTVKEEKVKKAENAPAKPKAAPAAPKPKPKKERAYTPPPPEVEEDDWAEVKAKPKKPTGTKKAVPVVAAVETIVSSAKTVTLAIPKEKVGVLIGPKGETMNKFQDAFDARINIPRQAEGATSYSREVNITIEGPASSIAQCKREINDFMTKGICKTINGNYSEGSVQIHPDYFHLLIGPGGSTIHKLQEVLKVKLLMPPRSTQDKPQWVKIAGDKADIEAAKAEIKSMMKYYYSKIANPELSHIEMDLPSANYAAIIGIRGQGIKSIQGDTGCKVNIPRSHSKNQNVVVVGKSEKDLSRAKTQIERAIERYAQQTQRKYDDQDENWMDYSEDEEW